MTDETHAPAVPVEAPPQAPAAPEASRPAVSPYRRGMRWFLAEFLVVVAGILVAMGLNAWYQGHVEARNERQYLTLLGRDLEAMARFLDETIAFEELQIRDALLLYRALSAPGLPADTNPLSIAVSHLSERRTLMQYRSTYDDLINTGNFHLIRDAKLRDKIAEYYERTGLQFEVINKNNAFYVDENFNTRLVQSGLVQSRNGSNLPQLRASDAPNARDLAGGYADHPVDVLWRLPRDAPQWAMVRSNVMSRLKISRLSAYYCKERAAAARELKAALDAELTR